MSVGARLNELWHLLKARLAWLAGRRDRARIALKAALRRNPNGFTAHFLLGRLYLSERALVKARREFDLAWQIDPERFERRYARLRGQYEGAPDLFSYGMGDEGVRVPSGRHQNVRYLGDFMSEDERDRFQELPPISQEEIHRIDWDRLENEL